MEENKTQKDKTEANENIQDKKNRYSIYEYLKANPSVFLAVMSAGIAIVTFFAKLVTLIAAKKELSFWEFEPSYATFGNDSIIYTIIFSIVYSCLITLSSLLFSYTYEAYLPRKKCHLMTKYILNQKSLKELNKKSKHQKLNKQEEELLITINKLKESTSKSKKIAFKDFFFNLVLVLIISFCNSLLYAIVVDTNTNFNTWIIALVFLFAHLVILFIYKLLNDRRVIKRKEIKENCGNAEFIIKSYEEVDSKEYPLYYIFKNGFSSVLSNSNIISTVIMILLSCFSLCCMYSLTTTDYADNSKSFQITTIDNVSYAIVYKDNKNYFLEEIKIDETENPSEHKTLIVYTNCQRIITTDDILIRVEKFQEIKKEHKKENTVEKHNIQ